MRKTTLITALITLGCLGGFLKAEQSISGNMAGYRMACFEASQNDESFANFRRDSRFRWIVEISDGEAYVPYVAHIAKRLGDKLSVISEFDKVGNCPQDNWPGLGNFSASMLRYIVHADVIKKKFRLPKKFSVVEIGAGFGGQAFVMQQLFDIDQYYIYDLPETEALISRVAKTYNMKDVHCLPFQEELPVEKIDLLISNYAYSECDRDLQLQYFERVIKKADRGYMIYNKITDIYNIDSLSSKEFVELLKKNNMNPKVMGETICSEGNNVLIIWDKTRGGSKTKAAAGL